MILSHGKLLELVKQEAPPRIQEYKEFQERVMKEFLQIRDIIIKQLNIIEKKFYQLLSQIEQSDILISFYYELTQKGKKITKTRKEEIFSKLQNIVDLQLKKSNFKYNSEKDKLQHTINRLMINLQQTKLMIESLSQLDNEQYESKNQNNVQVPEQALKKKVKIQTQILSTQNEQTIDSKNTNFQLKYCLEEHSTAIYGLAISHDDKYIASGAHAQILGMENQEVYLWDLKKRAILKKYSGPDYASCLSFSKNNLKLVAAGCSRNSYDIFIYDIGDLTKNEPIQILNKHNHNIYRTIFTNNSNNLISCSYDSTIRVWDLNLTKEISKKQCINAVYGLCLSENEELIGCCCYGGFAYLFDSTSLSSLTEKVKWKANISETCCIEFIKHSTIILTSSRTEIKFWRVDDLLSDKKECFKEIQSLSNNSQQIWQVKAIPIQDPKLIIAGQGKIKIWQIETTQMEQSIKIPGGKCVFGLPFVITSNFKNIVAAAGDNQLKIYQNEF